MSCKDNSYVFCLFYSQYKSLASDSDINNVQATVDIELMQDDKWLKANRLSLNVSKTSYMITSNQKNTCNSIKICDLIIMKVYTVKYLSFTLDQFLLLMTM